MTRPTRLEHDCSTGQSIEIELTDLEIEANEAAAAAYLEQKAADEAEAATKAEAKAALLAKLNITEDEAKLLLA